jgi:hypothetical protein
MRKTAVLIASAVISGSTIPAVAAQSTSIKDIDIPGARRVTAVSQSVDAADTEKTCRGYVASFQESVMRRQAAAKLAGGERAVILIDSVINGFNDLLATKCGG